VRWTKKEVVLMRHENGTPAKRRLAALSTMLVVVLVVVLAAIVVGPGRAIDWLGNYLIPVLMVLGVIVGVFGLAAWEIAKLHDRHKQPW
jgi:branched-subunit amino acid permease